MSMSDDMHDTLKGWYVYVSLMLFSSAFMIALVAFITYSNKCISNNTAVESKVSTEVSTGTSTGNIDLSQYTVVIDEDNKIVHLKAK